MGIKLGSITELATGLLGSHKIPYTTGAITRLLRLDTLADWVVQTASSFVPSGTGAISRPMQTKEREIVSVTDFYANGVSGVGVDPTGVVDSTLGIQAAENALDAAGGGCLYWPAGTYKHTSAILKKKKVIWQGAGKDATKLLSTFAGDGVQSTWTINTSTSVYISIRDMTIANTNGANTGGGFVDVGGSFVTLEHVRVSGFKYSVIFDQTELGDIDYCVFDLPLTGALWLVNGSDHTALASTQFTNRISCNRTQFNNTGVGTAIIDDGGISHSFQDNNYNGFAVHGRFAGVTGLAIRGGEWEGATTVNGQFKSTTFNSGTAVGQCLNIYIGQGVTIVPATATETAFAFTNGTPVTLDGVNFGNSSGVKCTGLANVATLFASGVNNAGGGATFDATAAFTHVEFDYVPGQAGGGLKVKAGRIQTPRVVITYSVSMDIDASLGNDFSITATNGTAFAINAPTNSVDGQHIVVTVRNASGGVLGAITWNAIFKMLAFTSPTNGNSCSIDFRYDGTNWTQMAPQSLQIPN